jgi:hypothetical protein
VLRQCPTVSVHLVSEVDVFTLRDHRSEEGGGIHITVLQDSTMLALLEYAGYSLIGYYYMLCTPYDLPI